MLNKICIQGRLTKDPEVKNTSNQVACATFTIACERPFKENGNKTTDFFNIVAWRSTATFVGSYFHKGDMAIISGRLQTRSYDSRDGNKVYVTEIVADEINFGGSKNESKPTQPTIPEPTSESEPSQFNPFGDSEDGELPFDV